MTASCDVIVVGGGPVGAACARELALAGRRVLVLEPGGEMGQGWRAAAGMLAPQIEAHDEDPAARARPRRTRALLVARRRAAGDDGHRYRALAGGHRLGGGQRGGGGGAARPDARGSASTATSPTGSTPRKCRRAGPGSAPRPARSGPRARAPSSPRSWSPRCWPMPSGSARVVVQDTVTALDQRGDRVVGVVGRSGRYAAGEVVLAAGAWSRDGGRAAAAGGRGAGARADGRAALAGGRAPRDHLRSRLLHRRARRRGDRRLDDGVRRLPARGDLRRPGADLQRRHRALPHAHRRAVKRDLGRDSAPSLPTDSPSSAPSRGCRDSGTPRGMGGTAFCSQASPA